MKRIFKAIFDPPWWFLLVAWPVMFVLAFYYAWPSNMDHYVEDAATPEMKLAVVREIKGAEQRVALEFAARTLSKVARYMPDDDSIDGIDKALEEINKRIERGYIPPAPKVATPPAEGDVHKEIRIESKTEIKSKADEQSKLDKKSKAERKSKADEQAKAAEQSIADDLDKSDELAKADGSVIDAEVARTISRIKRRVLEQAHRDIERARRDRERARGAKRFGFEAHDNEDVHINLGILDQHLARTLEAKYGAGPVPPVDPMIKEEIYSGVKERVHHFVTGILTIVMLILLFPFFVFTKVVAAIIRMFSSRAETSQKAAEQNAFERQLSEAKLAAMQAQIEPHFLFNTMASVQQLILTDPPTAAKMQTDLIKYLRAAVPQMREAKTTLAREAELSRAYLDILKIRMEDRLKYVIDIPDSLGLENFPPMMLPTLVENAIKHGLEPLTAGGEIRISAVAGGGRLRVTVADTGLGFAEQPGQGVGLSNVRERLVAMYGRQAQLIVEPNQPRGARVTIEIPYAGGGTS